MGLVIDHSYTIQAAADAIGLKYATIYRWVKKARGDVPGRGGGTAPEATDVDVAAENRRLRSELARAPKSVWPHHSDVWARRA